MDGDEKWFKPDGILRNYKYVKSGTLQGKLTKFLAHARGRINLQGAHSADDGEKGETLDVAFELAQQLEEVKRNTTAATKRKKKHRNDWVQQGLAWC
jgi:hypothetical protein